MSPALVREIGKLGGVAAAITGFDEHGVPQGVVVIHVGDSDLVRGLVGDRPAGGDAQRVDRRATRPIAFPADGVELWMAQTERLLVLSPSREQVAGVVGRLKGRRGGQPEGRGVVSRGGRRPREQPAVCVGRFAAGGAVGLRGHGRGRWIRKS